MQIQNPSASLRFRDEGGVERHLAVAPTLVLVEMVRGRSTPVILGGHFHVTRFGMFRSRAGLALNPWSTAESTACLQAPALSPHSKGDIRTAPPSRSRVKNDYSILGMLSRGKFSLPPLSSSSFAGSTRASATQMERLIHSTSLLFGAAPTCVEATWPFLNSIRVGMPRTP